MDIPATDFTIVYMISMIKLLDADWLRGTVISLLYCRTINIKKQNCKNLFARRPNSPGGTKKARKVTKILKIYEILDKSLTGLVF